MKANLVPVGADQLPHLELVRQIARRFNGIFSSGNSGSGNAGSRPAVFPEPEALLSEAPRIAGLNGSAKMSKSRNNSIDLSQMEDETARLIRSAKADSDRTITFDPEKRPGVSNLILILSMIKSADPARLAEGLGDSGAAELKKIVTEAVNEYLRPARIRRKQLLENPDFLVSVLKKGRERARQIAADTLRDVKRAMNMDASGS